MSRYLPRSLAPHLLQPGVPVLVVEGARAVGKTRMMTEEVAPALNTQVVSLADPTTFTYANDDPAQWLASLPRPCVIDEAQLLPKLPLHIKLLVDQRGLDLQFVLTGSARIGRDGLGGADPLTRRARRFTLQPLTAWELFTIRGNLVDDLFDAELNTAHSATWPDNRLHSLLQRGGFPAYALADNPDQATFVSQITNDTKSTLGERVLPGVSYDLTTAETVLGAFFTNPGRRFNATKFQQLVNVDRRTITRYVDIFERLFLTYHLPNLAHQPDKRGPSGAKIHPVDVALAYAALTKNRVDWQAQRDVLGKMLESFVAQQVRSHAALSMHDVECFFWATAKPAREVDLVLAAADGRYVGIECKLNQNVKATDLAGLRALDEAVNLHRGFVVYGGSTIKRLGEKFWALPAAALVDRNYFTRTESSVQPGHVTSQSGDGSPIPVTVMAAYLPDDDAHEGGRISDFVNDVAAEVEYQSGRQVTVISGEGTAAWVATVQQEVAEGSLRNEVVTLAICTPRFRQSPEYQQLLAACQNTSTQVAQAIWQTHPNDQLFNESTSHQVGFAPVVDATNARFLAADSGEYRQLVATVAGTLIRRH